MLTEEQEVFYEKRVNLVEEEKDNASEEKENNSLASYIGGAGTHSHITWKYKSCALSHVNLTYSEMWSFELAFSVSYRIQRFISRTCL